jgi:pimeloyl-ACP methyl ester carboxylesterase
MNTRREELVVLVHGLWMHGVVMEVQRALLARMGFDAVCYSYPSARLTLGENADRLALFARTLAASRVHWVAHSLGGLVTLHMLDREPDLPPGRVVLLGTPYHACEARRAGAATWFGSHMNGRSLGEWLAIEKSAPISGREIGVIAGRIGVGLGRVVAHGLPSPHDGAVAVEETDIATARDRIVLSVSHTGMLFSREVARQTAAFLRDGRFDHDARA